MKRTIKKLTELEIKKAEIKDKDYNLSDGDGLYFIVRKNGSIVRSKQIKAELKKGIKFVKQNTEFVFRHNPSLRQFINTLKCLYWLSINNQSIDISTLVQLIKENPTSFLSFLIVIIKQSFNPLTENNILNIM